eukprot:UN07292
MQITFLKDFRFIVVICEISCISLTSTATSTLVLITCYRMDFNSWKFGVPSESRKLIRIRWSILLLIPFEDIVQ